jgi:hypothetical protein
MFFEPIEYVGRYTVDDAFMLGIGKNRQVNRSLMHPQYARRFIKSYVLDGELWQKQADASQAPE